MATVSNIIIKITRIHNSDLPVVARSGWILAFIRRSIVTLTLYCCTY